MRVDGEGTRTHCDKNTIQKMWGENNIASAPYLMGRQPELKLSKHLGTEIFCRFTFYSNLSLKTTAL